jgi:hypothetical protein
MICLLCFYYYTSKFSLLIVFFSNRRLDAKKVSYSSSRCILTWLQWSSGILIGWPCVHALRLVQTGYSGKNRTHAHILPLSKTQINKSPISIMICKLLQNFMKRSMQTCPEDFNSHMTQFSNSRRMC